MSVNRYVPHVVIIPEDDANRQVINGFMLHPSIQQRKIDVRTVAGGGQKVFDLFESEMVPYLKRFDQSCVILVIDFDGEFENRIERFNDIVQNEFIDRVFIIGCRDEPEAFKSACGFSLETIGDKLATDCLLTNHQFWTDPHLSHNAPMVERLSRHVKSIIFN